jgi:UDP-N-acetylmuramate dehydrogenase
MNIQKDIELQKYNTFGLSATAKYFIEVNSATEADELINSDLFKKEKSLIIGGGSNLLFTHDFNGIVVKANIGGIHVVKEDDDFFWVKAGAGVVWHDLVESCIKANFGGIENLSLIPGTVGAAPIQNIGAYGVELKDSFEALEAIDLNSGEKKYFRNHECQFGYRNSVFKNELKDSILITNVVLRLYKKPILNLEYGNIKQVLEQKGLDDITLRDVSDAIIKIRQSKLPDPKEIGNAGSFFKNPIVPHELFNRIKDSYPEIPSYKQDEGNMKIPAAWLIDQCNFKGFKHKGAAVHDLQPLVIINKDNASGLDIVELAHIIQNKVKEDFGISLSPEVTII